MGNLLPMLVAYLRHVPRHGRRAVVTGSATGDALTIAEEVLLFALVPKNAAFVQIS